MAGVMAGIGALYGAAALPEILAPAMQPGTIIASIILAAALVVLSAIDVRTLRLPDTLTLPLAVAGLAFAAGLQWDIPVSWRLGAAAGGYLFVRGIDAGYKRLRGRSGIGQGDAKLLAAAGAWLGPEGLPATLLYACAGALLFVAARALAGQLTARTEALPFGPFLAGGIWLVWLYGPMVW